MIRALLLLVALAAAPLSAEPSLGPFVARDLAPGIHMLTTSPDFVGRVIGNIVIIEQSDGLVLVDSGGTIADGRRVVAYIRSFTAKPVKAVLITHWHSDHPLGIEAIRAVWPHLRIIATPQTRAGMLGPGLTNVGLRPDERYETMALNNLSAQLPQARAVLNAPTTDEARRQRTAVYIRNVWIYAHDFEGTYMVPPTETFTDQLLLDDPERPVRLMYLGRANTEGDAIAWLPRQRIVMSGDIVVSPIPFGFGSYPEDWIRVLERLKALDFALLVPGHGEPMTDNLYLDRLVAAISEIRAQVGPLARQGLTLEQVRQRVDFSAQTAIFATTPRSRLLFQTYWLEPMVENAWKEARGIPIVQGPGSTALPVSRPANNRGRRLR